MSGEDDSSAVANDRRENDTNCTRGPTPPLLRAANLGRVASVHHGFTTRAGGSSDGPWGPLNLARREGEPDDTLRAAWEAVARALHPDLHADRVALLHQVHGARVARVEAGSGPLRVVAEADAAYTTRSGVILAVRTADCVPVLVAGEGAVGVAHAGWRGTAGGVVPALVEALVGVGEAPEGLVAAIGPAISGAVYEVGDEVVEGLRAAGLADRDFLVGSSGRPRVDLQAAVRAQLEGAGVRDVEVLRICTLRDARMHSHRRDGARAGRQAAIIARYP